MLEIIAYSNLPPEVKEEFLEIFCSFPQLTRQDPWRKNILPSALLRALIEFPLPVPKEFWLAKRDGQAVGICAANVSLSEKKTGYFGLFELDLRDSDSAEVGRHLLSHSESWLKSKNIERILGPIALSTWFPYRWRTDQTDLLALDWEPGQPKEFVECAVGAGFSPVMDYYSLGTGNPQALCNSLEVAHTNVIQAGFSFEVLKATELHKEHLLDLHFITHEAFTGSYLFDPIPLPIFENIYAPMIASPTHNLRVIFCITPTGLRCGYLVCFVQGEALVFKSAGNAQSRTGMQTRVLNPMFFEALRATIPLGITEMHCALMRGDNKSMFFAKRFVSRGGELWRHTYTLFEKKLA